MNCINNVRCDLINLNVFPKLDLPVYSLFTLNDDGTTNANIVTYANTISLEPSKWSISLYKDTLSHHNFLKRNWGLLQILDKNEHLKIIEVLGKNSGNNIDKMIELKKIDENLIETIELELTNCISSKPCSPLATMDILCHSPGMVLLEVCSDDNDDNGIFDVGDHDMVICRPLAYFQGSLSSSNSSNSSSSILTTSSLREIGIL